MPYAPRRIQNSKRSGAQWLRTWVIWRKTELDIHRKGKVQRSNGCGRREGEEFHFPHLSLRSEQDSQCGYMAEPLLSDWFPYNRGSSRKCCTVSDENISKVDCIAIFTKQRLWIILIIFFTNYYC